MSVGAGNRVIKGVGGRSFSSDIKEPRETGLQPLRNCLVAARGIYEDTFKMEVIYYGKHGGSAEPVEGFGEAVAFADGAVAGFAKARLLANAGFAAEAPLPTVRYLRIFSSRFGPMPRIASKSSTLLNAPYALRICRIFSAVAGPIPGTSCNCPDVAVFRLTGAAGGFFFAPKAATAKKRAATARQIRAADITDKYYMNFIYPCNNTQKPQRPANARGRCTHGVGKCFQHFAC
jgi:hypothetical protein